RHAAGTEGAERCEHRLRVFRRGGGPDESGGLVDRRRQVEAEGLEAFLESALHQLPQAARDRRPSALGVVEMRIEIAKAQLPVATDLRGRQAVEVSGPRNGREAEAEEAEAEPRRPARDEADAPLPGLDPDVAKHERATAGAGAPEHGFAATVYLERVPQGAAEYLVVDRERETDLGRPHGRGAEEHAEEGGALAHRASLQTRKPGPQRTGTGLSGQDPAASYSPTRRPCSTIGAGGLNGRVRDGNGCFPSAIAAGNRIGDETSWT